MTSDTRCYIWRSLTAYFVSHVSCGISHQIRAVYSTSAFPKIVPAHSPQFSKLHWISREISIGHRAVFVDDRSWLPSPLLRQKLLQLLVEEDQRLAAVNGASHHGRHMIS